MKDLVKLGETLREARKNRGLKLVDAADQADVNALCVAALEDGDPYPGCPRDLWALSKFYGLDYCEMMILAGCLVPAAVPEAAS